MNKQTLGPVTPKARPPNFGSVCLPTADDIDDL